ncbi:MAG: hypothetical protein K2H93_08950, partial [Oscillospiraceae bacterium]|nr:hypothetical protein [Oscillospiraceae bacterium]
MSKLKALQSAKICMELLAQGIDPITKNSVPECEVIKNSTVTSCFQFIVKILEKDITAQEEITKRFFVSEERIKNLKAVDEPITITKIAQNINFGISPEENGFIPSSAISYWLEQQELLVRVISSETGNIRKQATDKAITYGIKNLYGKNGNVKNVVYTRQAQQWIYDSIPEISEFCIKNKEIFPQRKFIPPLEAVVIAEQAEKQEFNLTLEQKKDLHAFAPEAKISEITQYLNSLIDKTQVKTLKNGILSSWLWCEKLLTKFQDKTYIPTKDGEKIGILCQSYTRNGFEHQISIFTAQAQEYIFSHI